MPRTLEEYEAMVKQGLEPGGLDLTPESAIVNVDVASMAASGIVVFADVGDAICWFWRRCLENDIPAYQGRWASDDQVPPYVRSGRQRFRALLQHFVRDGYHPAMLDELAGIVVALDADMQRRGIYHVSGGWVLPDDLDDLLATFGNPLASDEDDDDEGAQRDEQSFDLNNPEHMAALERELEFAMN